MAKEVSLEERVLRFVLEHHLVAPGETIVVAVSGGPDSVCLLHLLTELKAELGITLHAAHLDHQLRGDEGAADAEYVADLARRLDIPSTIGSRDVKAYRAGHHLSLEEAAREVRYTFLAEVAGRAGASRVAVGHTADDHIETVLLHLVRGTGTRGLRGLQPVNRWHSGESGVTIVRPLLQVTHEETEAYCACHDLGPRRDASNLSLSPLRNRVRHQLLPLLRGFNPGIDRALARAARITAEDIAYLDGQVARLWADVAEEQGQAVILYRKRFLALPPALRRYTLRAAMERLIGNIMDIEARHMDILEAGLDLPPGRSLDLPSGLAFAVDYDRYVLSLEPLPSPFPSLDTEIPLAVPGDTGLPGWKVRAAFVKPEEIADAGPFTAYFDPRKTGRALSVRRRRPGDRFQPLGMERPKKLGEFMIGARIPRSWRDRIPLVCSPAQVVWVVGYRIDDRVKVAGTVSQILRLEFEPVPVSPG